MQISQPVQKSCKTVCIKFGAPIIASTGQKIAHFAHPIQFFSSINTVVCFFFLFFTIKFSSGTSILNTSEISTIRSVPPGMHLSIFSEL